MKPLINLLIIIVFILPFSNTDAQSKESIKVVVGYIKDTNGLAVRDVIFLVDSVRVEPKIKKSGAYRIKINAGTKEISAYASTGVKTVKYSGQKEINFVFAPYKTKKQSLEPDSQIDKKDMSDFGYDNIYAMIVAKVPGARLVNGNQINIRGTRSLDGTAKPPLFIVNGFEAAGIGHISPHEVNSITALKGSETTRYGVKGANGVILIKLKK